MLLDDCELPFFLLVDYWCSEFSGKVPVWLFNIAVENGPFIDYFPINTSIYQGFSMAMLNNKMVIPKSCQLNPTFLSTLASHVVYC